MATDPATPEDKQIVPDNQEKEKETPWIDAWIRWERDSKETYDDGDDDHLNDDDDSEKAKYIEWLLREEEDERQPVKVTRKEPKTKRQEKKNRNQPSFLTTDNFADRKDIHPASKRALTQILKVTSMTEIQSKTFAAASSGLMRSAPSLSTLRQSGSRTI